jgi:hypothetical protein
LGNPLGVYGVHIPRQDSRILLGRLSLWLGEKIWVCIIVPLAGFALGSGIWDLGFACTVELLGVPILLDGRYPGWER